MGATVIPFSMKYKQKMKVLACRKQFSTSSDVMLMIKVLIEELQITQILSCSHKVDCSFRNNQVDNQTL